MITIRRKPVGSDAAKQIRTAILQGRLAPGSRIAQNELAAKLGVSRLPIRQALLMLEREGLVHIDHHRGATVAPIDLKFIADLFAFRAVVDGLVAASLAARKDFDGTFLRQLAIEGQRAVRRGQLTQEASMNFHMALYRALDNRVLTSAMEPLLSHVRRVESIAHTEGPACMADGHPAAPDHQPTAERWDEHSEIIDAIERHQVGRARRLARTHVLRVRDVVMSYLTMGENNQSEAASRGKS